LAVSLNQFSQRIFKLANRIEPNANEMVKDAAKAFLTTVVNMTPVDEGTAVSSWKVGLNYKPQGTRVFAKGSKGSTAGANRAAVLADTLPKIEKRVTGITISIVNTAPHIAYLNSGSSRQAPAGFIEAAYQQSYIAIRRRKVLA
jgi:HK97 gp10 family phage protein